MDALSLNEAQGLTLEMVRVYLRDHLGLLHQKPFTGDMVWMHRPESEAGGIDWPPSLGLAYAVQHCAAARLAILNERYSIQETLAQINPRMHKGEPSDAAKEACQNTPWLARDEFGNPRVGFWSKRHSEAPWTFYVQGRGNLSLERVKAWSFWPANARLDKTRWPERDGVML